MFDFWSRLAILQWCAAISTLTLTAGAIIEYWEKLKHLCRLFLKLVLLRSNEYERCTLRRLFLHTIGPILVVFGIAG
jgi:hypothetical protein